MTMLDRMRRHRNWLKWSLGIVIAGFVLLYVPSFLRPAGVGAAPTDTLVRRLRERARRDGDDETPLPGDDYLAELNEAYNHYFFHYTATPLLVVETSAVDPGWGGEAVDALLRQLRTMSGGTIYYVPR